MKIKVEAEDYDIRERFDNISLNIMVFLITAGSLWLNMEKEMGHVKIMIVEIQITVVIMLMMLTILLKKLDSVRRWRKYILFAINEIEAEIRK